MQSEQAKPTNNNGTGTMQQPDALDAALQAARSEIDNPELSPQGCVKAALRRAAALDVHPVYREQFALIVDQFKRTAVTLLSVMNYVELRQKIIKFENEIWPFQQAPIEPLQADVWRSQAKAQGWTDSDFDLLISWGTRDGGSIARITWELAEMSDGGIFTLRALRLSQKSATSIVPDDVWLEQFPPIRDPNAPAPSSTVVFSDGDGGGTVFSDGRHENHK